MFQLNRSDTTISQKTEKHSKIPFALADRIERERERVSDLLPTKNHPVLSSLKRNPGNSLCFFSLSFRFAHFISLHSRLGVVNFEICLWQRTWSSPTFTCGSNFPHHNYTVIKHNFLTPADKDKHLPITN